MSKRLLILYKSKTGFTKKYAEMIAVETGGTAMDVKAAEPGILSSFDQIVFGSRMHAGRIDGLGDIRKLLRENEASLLALFVTGAMPNTETHTIADMWKNNLTEEELSSLPHFYMQSGLYYEKMGIFDRIMMEMFVFIMKHKKAKSHNEMHLAKIIAHSYDISSKDYIWPLVKYLNSK